MGGPSVWGPGGQPGDRRRGQQVLGVFPTTEEAPPAPPIATHCDTGPALSDPLHFDEKPKIWFLSEISFLNVGK